MTLILLPPPMQCVQLTNMASTLPLLAHLAQITLPPPPTHRQLTTAYAQLATRETLETNVHVSISITRYMHTQEACEYQYYQVYGASCSSKFIWLVHLLTYCSVGLQVFLGSIQQSSHQAWIPLAVPPALLIHTFLSPLSASLVPCRLIPPPHLMSPGTIPAYCVHSFLLSTNNLYHMITFM